MFEFLKPSRTRSRHSSSSYVCVACPAASIHAHLFFRFLCPHSCPHTSAGPRFSNAVLQCMLSWMSYTPADGRKLLVIATTSSYEKLRALEMTDTFTKARAARPYPSVLSLSPLAPFSAPSFPQDS